MATYRQKIRAYRRMQTATLRAELANLESIHPRNDQVNHCIRWCILEIAKCMYEPVHGTWLDTEAPSEWHPAGPPFNGSRLMEWY